MILEKKRKDISTRKKTFIWTNMVSTLTTLGIYGGSNSRLSSLDQSIELKNGCLITSSAEWLASNEPRRLLASFSNNYKSKWDVKNKVYIIIKIVNRENSRPPKRILSQLTNILDTVAVHCI